MRGTDFDLLLRCTCLAMGGGPEICLRRLDGWQNPGPRNLLCRRQNHHPHFHAARHNRPRVHILPTRQRLLGHACAGTGPCFIGNNCLAERCGLVPGTTQQGVRPAPKAPKTPDEESVAARDPTVWDGQGALDGRPLVRQCYARRSLEPSAAQCLVGEGQILSCSSFIRPVKASHSWTVPRPVCLFACFPAVARAAAPRPRPTAAIDGEVRARPVPIEGNSSKYHDLGTTAIVHPETPVFKPMDSRGGAIGGGGMLVLNKPSEVRRSREPGDACADGGCIRPSSGAV